MPDDPAGTVASIVNTGITVMKLVANHGAVSVVQGGYANGMPEGVHSGQLHGWRPKRITWPYDSGVTPWYDITSVDYKFKIGCNWMHSGSDGANTYVDQATVTLDIDHLPPDDTIDVTANFPSQGLLGDNTAALSFTIRLQYNYFFGQLVGFTQTLNVTIRGDGTYDG